MVLTQESQNFCNSPDDPKIETRVTRNLSKNWDWLEYFEESRKAEDMQSHDLQWRLSARIYVWKLAKNFYVDESKVFCYLGSMW